MIETSSFLGSLQQSLVIFGNFWKLFGNIHGDFKQYLENLWKSSRVVGNLLLLIDMKYLFLCSSLYPTLLLHLTVRHWVKHPKRYSIFTHAHVFFSISFFHNCWGRLRTVSIIQVFTSSLQFKSHKFIYSLWILHQLGKNYKPTNRPIGVHVDDNVHMYSCCS